MAEYSDSEVRTVALAIIGGVFFGGVATGVAFPTLPLLDDLLGISAIMLSIILSANRIARLFMNTPAGSVIDRVGARKPMIVGLFTQALAPFGYVVGLYTPADTVATLPVIGDVSAAGIVFVLARAFWGFGSAFVFIGAFATITYVTTQDNRGRWVGLMRGGQSLGFPTGLMMGGILTDLIDVQTAFLTAGVLALLAGIVAAIVLPDVKPETDTQSAKLREIPALIRQRPSVLPIGFGNFTVQFLWGGIILSTLVRYADLHNMELSVLGAAGVSGVVMGVGVVVSGITTVISGRLSDQVENRAIVTVPAFLALALGFGIILVPTIEFLFLGIVFTGIGIGGAAPALLAILGDITPGDEVGRMAGVFNVMGDIGLSLGPLVAIPAVDLWFGYRLTYILCGALVLSCLLVVSVPLLRTDMDVLTSGSSS